MTNPIQYHNKYFTLYYNTVELKTHLEETPLRKNSPSNYFGYSMPRPVIEGLNEWVEARWWEACNRSQTPKPVGSLPHRSPSPCTLLGQIRDVSLLEQPIRHIVSSWKPSFTSKINILRLSQFIYMKTLFDTILSFIYQLLPSQYYTFGS